MGVVRDSARGYICKSVSEQNELNEILSSDVESIQRQQDQRKVRRKKKSIRNNTYSCKKNVDPFLAEVSAELGIDTDLQDIAPTHNSPLSSLFNDPEKMRLWLVFIDSPEDIQDKMLRGKPKNNPASRFKRISRSVRNELGGVSISTIEELENLVYNTLRDTGLNGIIVLSTPTKEDLIALTAIAQYSRLKSTPHSPINVIEVEVGNKKFKPLSMTLSHFLSHRMLKT